MGHGDTCSLRAQLTWLPPSLQELDTTTTQSLGQSQSWPLPKGPGFPLDVSGLQLSCLLFYSG